MKRLNLAGQKFGFLTAISVSGFSAHGAVLWLCRCDCGNECVLSGSNVKTGNTISCGCKASRNRFRGSTNPKWNGGKANASGYVMLLSPGHPRAKKGSGHVMEHILIAEKALGRYMPDHAEVHHVNEIRDDNRNTNLVICEDCDYHRLLHARMRAYRATGDPTMRKCPYCKQWDRIEALQVPSEWKRQGPRHRECQRAYTAAWKAKRAGSAV